MNRRHFLKKTVLDIAGLTLGFKEFMSSSPAVHANNTQ
jgi:hypothetical protein